MVKQSRSFTPNITRARYYHPFSRHALSEAMSQEPRLIQECTCDAGPIPRWIRRDLILDGYIYVHFPSRFIPSASSLSRLSSSSVQPSRQGVAVVKVHRTPTSRRHAPSQRNPPAAASPTFFSQANYMGMLHLDPNLQSL